ncbi:MAG: tRNA (adenosine(37)-N6)-dimethylallyltransferase MiaA [Clostridia bacterium]|nr:tRNA (adenosine(37)-N6)-dimethylallyltransferase MiaA [Clostridia bacterium]
MSNTTKKSKVIVIVGPTASGKTRLAIKVAQRFGGEIISADSMQIYKGMPIATAAPTQEEKALAVHHLVEFLEADKRFSVADYVSLAKKCIDDILSRGKLPVIVGGTGLYINSLIDGIEFCEEGFDADVRGKLEEEFEELGGEQMLLKLMKFDPDTAKRLNKADKRRIIRAFEVFYTTGKTLTEQNGLSRKNGKPYEEIMIGITYDDREKLYERINSRVDIMLNSGLIDEARAMLKKGETAAQAIGHKEFGEYLNGSCTLEEATEKLKRETRRYAKRQLTWFRRDSRINWIYADKENVTERAYDIIERKL